MENASKALIMAGGILIGVIILTTMVLAFNRSGQFANEYDEKIEKASVAKFNSQFTKYDLTKYNEETKKQEPVEWSMHDLITITNLAKNYNDKVGETAIEVIVTRDIPVGMERITTEEQLQKYGDLYKFTYKGVTYNEVTGAINTITFEGKKVQ